MLRALVALGLLAGPAHAFTEPRTPLDDPFRTGMLGYHQINLLGDPERIALDDRVKVWAPYAAEDSLHVPVTVDATAIPDVRRIVAFVDYGPIPKILEFEPGAAEAKLSFRFKIDQATPVRAAVETADGRWFVGGTRVDAAGGGCTTPAEAYASDDWMDRLGEVRARQWPEAGRVRVIVDHPMDTGLVDGIPVFIIESLTLSDAEGAALTRVTLFEPVEEDPTFTFHLPPERLGGKLRLTGRDNNGNPVDAVIPAPGPTQ